VVLQPILNGREGLYSSALKRIGVGAAAGGLIGSIHRGKLAPQNEATSQPVTRLNWPEANREGFKRYGGV